MSENTVDQGAETPPSDNPGQQTPAPQDATPVQQPQQGDPTQPVYQQVPVQQPYQTVPQPQHPYGAPVQQPYQQPYQQAPGQPGYQQAPGQYQQVPGPGAYQPYQQAPGQTGYQQGYQQAPGQPGYQQIPGQYPPYQPYAPASPYQQAPAKRKVWPWVLAGCLVFALLSLGGCVSCVACSVMSYENSGSSRYYDDYGYDYDYNYDYDMPYGYESPYDYYYDDGTDSGTYDYSFTKDELEKMKAEQKGSIEGDLASVGMYEVGSGKDLKAGLYYLSGSQTEEGSFFVFSKDSSGSYELAASVVYFGNYYVDLEDGSYISFIGPKDSTMCLAENSTFKPEGPTYQSGCYRVGIDIPAGTYKASYVSDAVLTEDNQEAGVYVMKDLDWTEESIVESYNLIAGSGPEITVEDGQYVELYAASMTPVSA